MLGTDHTLDDLIDLVAAFAGLRLGSRDEAGFRQIVQRRLEALKLRSWQEYYTLLSVAKNHLLTTGPADQALQEWHCLLNQLTIGESYFFRDERQFALLREQLIPDLLAAKRQAGGIKQLRVWSAGCATGEEVYSLVILLQEMGLAQEGWSLNVVGTDINQDFLAKAERGLYNPWSFRQTAVPIKQQYFLPERGDSWRIQPTVRRLAQFFEFNLAQDAVARLIAAGPFDLILCRNVFIYFTPSAIATTLTKFYEALAPGGYLVTGHAELQGIPLGDFRVRSFPASVIYQRPAAVAALGQPTPAKLGPLPASRPTPRLIPSRSSRLVAAAPPAAQPATPAQAEAPAQTFAQALAEAQALANVGSYSAAQKACEVAISACPFAVEPCYLLANIAEETGDIEGAKVFLKRVIYLDPSALPAHLELANLYDLTQDPVRAAKSRRQALNILGQLPATQTVVNGLSAATLGQQLRTKLLG